MSYIWTLAHPQNVEHSEEVILALAAPLARGEMRDGTIRPPHPPYIPRRIVRSPEESAVASRASSAEPSLISNASRGASLHNSRPVTPALSNASSDNMNNGFGGGDEGASSNIGGGGIQDAPEDTEPGVNPREAFEEGQRGCIERRVWSWSTIKSNGLYKPIRQGKWWYLNAGSWDALTPGKQRDYSHIARIMESELGEELLAEKKCSSCRSAGFECWVYSDRGKQQISRPGSTCARCREAAHKGGCSLSTRIQH
ncbi:hypothetical protein NHQ30_011369 [Ciborinia camelliae]|nr:hypothetical protein NHQ30_011369 [Ciborinia camelliae]